MQDTDHAPAILGVQNIPPVKTSVNLNSFKSLCGNFRVKVNCNGHLLQAEKEAEMEMTPNEYVHEPR